MIPGTRPPINCCSVCHSVRQQRAFRPLAGRRECSPSGCVLRPRWVQALLRQSLQARHSPQRGSQVLMPQPQPGVIISGVLPLSLTVYSPPQVGPDRLHQLPRHARVPHPQRGGRLAPPRRNDGPQDLSPPFLPSVIRFTRAQLDRLTILFPTPLLCKTRRERTRGTQPRSRVRRSRTPPPPLDVRSGWGSPRNTGWRSSDPPRGRPGRRPRRRCGRVGARWRRCTCPQPGRRSRPITSWRRRRLPGALARPRVQPPAWERERGLRSHRRLKIGARLRVLTLHLSIAVQQPRPVPRTGGAGPVRGTGQGERTRLRVRATPPFRVPGEQTPPCRCLSLF